MAGSEAPVRPLELGPLDLIIEARDGAIFGHSSEEEQGYSDNVIQWLRYWGGAEPTRIFLAERPAPGAPGWTNITYVETYEKMRSLALALLSKNVSVERPVVVLSGNGIDHALIALASMFIGVPYAPVSPSYSLIGDDFSRLKDVIAQLTPGLVYVSDGAQYAAAIEAAVPADVEIIVSRNPPAGRKASLFAPLVAPIEEEADLDKVMKAHDVVEPETIAKILFTSGSTGAPKGVITTHKMLCSNQAMIEYFLQFLIDEPPVLVDWLPWHHSFGGNQNLGLVLRHGGTLYIDAGNLTPEGITESLRNLKEVGPTLYFNVPAGYQALVPHLQADKDLAATFFSNLSMAFVASAAMSEETYEAFEACAAAACGDRIQLVSGYGATETGPAALFSLKGHSGHVGFPLPGVQVKLAEKDGKFECLLQSASVSPGYWRDAEATAASFDEEGYYRTGDALAYANPEDPAAGFAYDGRLAEDFMLASGSWVSTGPLRAQCLEAFTPYVLDVVVAGRDQSEIGLLVFLKPEAKASDEAVRSFFKTQLAALAAKATGASNRVMRLLLLEGGPSAEAHEITDKGSINQQAVLDARKADVAELYAGSTKVITA